MGLPLLRTGQHGPAVPGVDPGGERADDPAGRSERVGRLEGLFQLSRWPAKASRPPRHGPARRDLLGTGALLTGLAPSGHGIVGNRWYFRELGEPLLWRQSNALVGGEKVWETARRAMPGYRAANLCWWYAIGASTDITLTPKRIYHADGRKSPDCYTVPAGLQAVRPRPRAGG